MDDLELFDPMNSLDPIDDFNPYNPGLPFGGEPPFNYIPPIGLIPPPVGIVPPFSFIDTMDDIDIMNYPSIPLIPPIDNVPTEPIMINGIEVSPHPNYQYSDHGTVNVIDILGQKHDYYSMEQAMGLTDMFSGFPVSNNTTLQSIENKEKLAKSEIIENDLNYAVNEYQKAEASGDINEMAKWKSKATELETDHRNLWDAPNYTGEPPKVKGIDY